jgi:hypothetical protein
MLGTTKKIYIYFRPLIIQSYILSQHGMNQVVNFELDHCSYIQGLQILIHSSVINHTSSQSNHSGHGSGVGV